MESRMDHTSACSACLAIKSKLYTTNLGRNLHPSVKVDAKEASIWTKLFSSIELLKLSYNRHHANQATSPCTTMPLSVIHHFSLYDVVRKHLVA